MDAIAPFPDNPRTHPKKGSPRWNAFRKAIETSCWDPLKVNRRNGQLISGEFRWKMLKDLGRESAVVLVYDVDDVTHRQMVVASNIPLGEFDQERLAELVQGLEAEHADMSLLCMTEEELALLIDGPCLMNETVQPEELMSQADDLQRKWQVKPGDHYRMGDHHLICGDCASLAVWDRMLNGRQVDAGWFDPPYGIDYGEIQDARNQSKERDGKTSAPARGLVNDDVSVPRYKQLVVDWFTTSAALLKPGGVLYVAHADKFRVEIELAARDAGFFISQNLVWVKPSFTLGRSDYKYAHEPILYMWKKGGPHYWQGGYNKSTVRDDTIDLKKLSKPDLITLLNEAWNADPSTVSRHPRGVSSTLHPTIKPLHLVADQVWRSTRKDEVVVEFFSGSGTTIAACHQTGRRCVATDIDPVFCAVTLERASGYGLPIEKVMHAG